MALWQATQVAANAPLLNADGANDTIAVFGDFVIPTGFASGDVVEMCGLPAGYVPVDAILDVPSSLGAAVTADVGILTGLYQAALDMSGAARSCGSDLISAASLGTAGIYRPTKPGANSIAPVTDAGTVNSTYAGTLYDRGIGFKATTVTTPVVGAKVRMTLTYRPQIAGA